MTYIPKEYNIIIEKLNNLLHPLEDKDNIHDSINNYAIELYETAICLHKFQENGGDLNKDYGDGYLIARFFYNIDHWYPHQNYNLINRELINLDQEQFKKIGTYIYKELVREHIQFLRNWDQNHVLPNRIPMDEISNLDFLVKHARNLSLKVGIPPSEENHFEDKYLLCSQLDVTSKTMVSKLNNWITKEPEYSGNSYINRITAERIEKKVRNIA